MMCSVLGFFFYKLYFAAGSGMGRKKARSWPQSCKFAVTGTWTVTEKGRWADR